MRLFKRSVYKKIRLPVKPISPILFLCLVILIYSGCETRGNIRLPEHQSSEVKSQAAETRLPADAASILAKAQVPVLCYHQLRDFKSSDSLSARDYIVPVSTFRQHIKALADSGYQTLLPQQLSDYLVYGQPLPPKPVMITFDDTRSDQFDIALPELNKYGFKGVFFIMTVSIGKPGYMNKEQIRQLAAQGHIIGLHTWDHKNVKNYSNEDWEIQINKPRKQLESVTGKKIEHFAYPFGLWNKEALLKIKQLGFKSAFQLSAKRDEDEPLYCIRRIIVPGNWSTTALLKHMKGSF